MEEKAGINEPLIRLAEVTEPLGMPGNKSIEEVEKWLVTVNERRTELRKATRTQHRIKLFESKEESTCIQDKYVQGVVKGIAARIMYKSKGVHTIDNVWLKDADGEYRLSQDPGEVVAETEEFFFEWMRSRAKEWGTKEERRRFQFPERPKTHSDIPAMQWVGEKIEVLLPPTGE